MQTNTDVGNDEKNKSISPMEEKLLSIFKEDGPSTRDQLVKKLETPRTTVYDGLKNLIESGTVIKYPFHVENAKRGRPQVLFSLK